MGVRVRVGVRVGVLVLVGVGVNVGRVKLVLLGSMVIVDTCFSLVTVGVQVEGKGRRVAVEVGISTVEGRVG